MKQQKYLYGVVEGFFSKPLPIWTKNERITTLEFIVEYASNINSYYYCPKDDYYVAEKWDSLYPDSKVKDLKAIVDFCSRNNISFIYGLNPEIVSNEDASSSDFKKKILTKFKQLQAIGINSFSLLFDDIPEAYDVLDNNVQEKDLLDSLVSVVNEVYGELKADKFLFCGPDYCFNSANKLNIPLQKLDARIGIIWSGNSVFSNKITLKDINRVRGIIGKDKKLIFWLNYPVNDCEQSVGTFNLGPFPEMFNSLHGEFDGIFVNPMRECYANLPFYITFSDFIQKQNEYNSLDAWKNAFKILFNGQAAKFIKIVNEFSTRNIMKLDIGYLARQIVTLENSNFGWLERWNQEIEEMRIFNDGNYGELFVKAIKSMLEESKAYIKVIEFVLKNKEIAKEDFEKISRFPTSLNKARYAKEILSIVKAKLMILPSYNEIYNERLFDLEYSVNLFSSKYRGKKSLEITDGDEKTILEVISLLVGIEIDSFIEFLNAKDIKTNTKLNALAKRQNTNRFTIAE